MASKFAARRLGWSSRNFVLGGGTVRSPLDPFDPLKLKRTFADFRSWPFAAVERAHQLGTLSIHKWCRALAALVLASGQESED